MNRSVGPQLDNAKEKLLNDLANKAPADAAADVASKLKANEATAANVEKLAQRGVRGGDAANNAGSKAVEPKSAIDLEREKVCILYFFCILFLYFVSFVAVALLQFIAQRNYNGEHQPEYEDIVRL